MATSSITAPFVVNADDFYKALDESMRISDEGKKLPHSERAESRPMAKEEIMRLVDKK
jgi:hypothetical protein